VKNADMVFLKITVGSHYCGIDFSEKMFDAASRKLKKS
jgi:hypothetical protein